MAAGIVLLGLGTAATGRDWREIVLWLGGCALVGGILYWLQWSESRRWRRLQEQMRLTAPYDRLAILRRRDRILGRGSRDVFEYVVNGEMDELPEETLTKTRSGRPKAG